MKKVSTLLLSLLLVLFTAFAAVGCDKTPSAGGGGSNTPDGGKNPPENTGKVYTWNSEPEIVDTFYDDFSKGISSDVWTSDDKGWGTGNNGTRVANVMYSTDKEKVEAEGATGGIAVLRATGDYAEDKNKQRQGAVIITKKAFGAGRYEARVRVLPRQGQCTALWTYWNGTPDATTLAESKYSEIDIELPERGDFRQMSGTTYKAYIDKKNLEHSSSRINFAENGMADFSLNDGKWHTLAFEWRTAENDTGIIWYVDGKTVLKITDNVPKYTATFWVGTHFPDNPSWLGVPNFDTAYMYVDYVKIQSYADETVAECQGSSSSFTFTDLGSSDIPQTDYVINGNFSRGTDTSAVGWEADLGSSVSRAEENYVSCLKVASGNRVFQTIDSRYIGHDMKLTVNARRTSGNGEVRVYLEEYYGGVLPKGKSDALVFKFPFATTRSNTYKIKDDKTDSLRIVIETDEGTEAEIYSVVVNENR